MGIVSGVTKKNPLDANSGKALYARIGWQFWVVAMSLPWLLPTHADPWASFYSEFLFAVVWVPLFAWAGLASKQPWKISWPVIFLMSISVVPAAQALTGLLVFPSEALLLMAYIIAFASSVSLGQRAQEVEPYRLVDGLFASLIIASLLSVGIALYQWFGLDMLGVLVPLTGEGGRAAANVAQPNNLCTLLVWGLLALWWGYFRRHIGGLCATFCAAFFLIGIALTGSRTGWVQLVFLAFFSFFARGLLNTKRQAVSLVFLMVWFCVWVVALVPVGEFFWGAASRDISQMFTAGSRLKFWVMALEAIADKPVFGYGWNQVVTAHVALSERFSGVNETMGHAHNILLDLLLWNGVFLGGLIVGGCMWWGCRQVRLVESSLHLLLMLALGVFLIHAMLELPHMYSFFLFPVGAMIGIVSALKPVRALFVVSRAVGLCVVLVFSAFLVAMFGDYKLIEAELAARRMLAAKIYGAEPPPPSRAMVLQGLQDALNFMSVKPGRGMSSTELGDMHRAVVRYPETGGLFRYAQSAALNGRAGEARWALGVICNLHSSNVCDSTINDWKSISALEGQEMSSVILPAVPKVSR